MVMSNTGFRPLSRYIGLYLARTKNIRSLLKRFPSPLEVYRFISQGCLRLYLPKNQVSVPSRGI